MDTVRRFGQKLYWTARAAVWLACVISLLLTAFTFAPLGWTLGGASLLFLAKPKRRTVAVFGLLLAAALTTRWISHPSASVPGRVLPEAPGQYSARSNDTLGLVSVRAVLRAGTQGNVLVFVEANTLPFSGLDSQTLNREVHRTLETQAIPEQPAPESDRTTAYLYYAALAEALEPGKPPEEVECPKGVSAPETFWGMYPAEFSHTCRVSTVPNGEYWGQSTAPIPVTARLTVKEGRIERVVFNGPLSPYGRNAAATMEERMLGADAVGVDIVSGATQTGYAVRSAANSACENARQQHQPNQRHAANY